MSLTSDEIDRHRRHILLKEIGGPGVQKLRNASVSIIGAGALGGPCALFLAAAGVGQIELWDDDIVEQSNLQRQIQFRAQRLRPRASPRARLWCSQRLDRTGRRIRLWRAGGCALLSMLGARIAACRRSVR